MSKSAYYKMAVNYLLDTQDIKDVDVDEFSKLFAHHNHQDIAQAVEDSFSHKYRVKTTFNPLHFEIKQYKGRISA